MSTGPAKETAGVSAAVAPAQRPQAETLLEVTGLSVDYGSGPGAVHAVNQVDFRIRRGEVIGVAGESGSGKSTLAHAVTRLLRPPATVTAGQIIYHSGAAGAGPIDILELSPDQLRRLRWEEIAVVFQSAMNALNPVIDLESQLVDALRTHRPNVQRAARTKRAAELLDLVGVSRDRLRSYPHELSGGMRQRAMIAMALILDPALIVMDEPTTALDVVTQRQILDQLEDLRHEFGFTLMFITHDLSLLLDIADTIAVMYAGSVVELSSADQLYSRPAHPYTQGLLRSFPSLTGPRKTLVGLPGHPPDLRELPAGCPFAPRCEHVWDRCRSAAPPLLTTAAGEPPQLAACWLHEERSSADG
jgi:oligopeptide/dipeptide ABC transporter ATP-binding protein